VSDHPVIHWQEAGAEKSVRWRSESGTPPPRRVVIADDRISADAAYRLACEGTALLWRGDFQNARQLLHAMARRIDELPRRPRNKKVPATPAEAFHLYRLAQSQRARTLGMLLLPFEADHSIPLRRAPDVQLACTEVYGPATEPYITSLRELQGIIGAHEWRKNGLEIPVLGARIHPHYGVFAPIRGEYIGLVNEAPLPASLSPTLSRRKAPLSNFPPQAGERANEKGNLQSLREREQTNRCADDEFSLDQSVAFDIGTGTGVLAAVLARRGIRRIIATDQYRRALACARENIARLNFAAQVEVVPADLFPEGRAALVVCNPPWIPGRPSSPLDHAIFDPESRMLRGFLNGLAAHLETGGEGWLILSDLAEHLGLRTRAELLSMVDTAGLQVLGKIDVKPTHPRVSDSSDPLHAARAAEITSLWRLCAKPS